MKRGDIFWDRSCHSFKSFHLKNKKANAHLTTVGKKPQIQHQALRKTNQG
jgi:competence transcription factor ComK